MKLLGRWAVLGAIVSCACFPPGAQAVEGEQAEAFRITAVLKDDEALNEAHDVELWGELALVAGKGGAVAVVEVAEPQSPRLVWFRRDRERLADAETVLLMEDRLLLGARDFHSLDLSDPRSPTIDATLADRSKIDTVNGMVRRGEYVFCASKRGLVSAIDVSEPAAPRMAGVLPTRPRFDVRDPHDLDLFGAQLVVVDPNGFGRRGPGSVALFRVLDDAGRLLPDSKWTLTGRLSSDSLQGANRVQVRGDYALVGCSRSPQAEGGEAHGVGVVVDLSDPARPREAAAVDFPHVRGPNGLTIAGDVWFLAGGQTVEAYDIRRPGRPRRLASFTSAKAFPTADDNAHDLVYRNGWLYVTSQGDNALVVLRVEDEQLRRLADDVNE